MAGRPLGKRHQDDVRAKIQASVIIGRLSKHVEGKLDLTNTQIKAAEILLKKTLPDLSQVQGPGDDGSHRFELVAPWLTKAIAERNG